MGVLGVGCRLWVVGVGCGLWMCAWSCERRQWLRQRQHDTNGSCSVTHPKVKTKELCVVKRLSSTRTPIQPSRMPQDRSKGPHSGVVTGAERQSVLKRHHAMSLNSLSSRAERASGTSPRQQDAVCLGAAPRTFSAAFSSGVAAFLICALVTGGGAGAAGAAFAGADLPLSSPARRTNMLTQALLGHCRSL